MKLWKQWSRKLDGWVERRRRYQSAAAPRTLESTEKAPPAQPETRASAKAADSGKTR